MRALSYLQIFLATGLCSAQGVFDFGNSFARTRIGTLDGSLADTNILGLALVGAVPDSLAPLGSLHIHWRGLIGVELITVPWAPPLSTVQVQMAVWDGSLWGTNLAAVPPDQIGRTDVVPVFLVNYWQAPFSPRFTQPAIVPLVPEPSASLLGLMGTSLAWLRHRDRKRPHPFFFTIRSGLRARLTAVS